MLLFFIWVGLAFVFNSALVCDPGACLDAPPLDVLCCFMREEISELIYKFCFEIAFRTYSVSESDVFRQHLASFIHFTFWNVVFICSQNDVGVFSVCGVCLSV